MLMRARKSDNCQGGQVRHPDKKVKSVAELIKGLKPQGGAGGPVWFRGQARASWNLSPTLARNKKTALAESSLIKRFKQNALTHVIARPQTEWEWMFLMQHYRLPTRLLDWTESPLAALYFAIENSKYKNDDAALWCIDPVALNEHANINFESNVEIPAFDHDDVLENYLPTKIAGEKTSEFNPIAAIAVRNSPRIAAQLGTFTITHRTHTPIEEVGTSKHVWRLIIPKEAKGPLLTELTQLRVSRLTLFPELDSVAADAMEIVK